MKLLKVTRIKVITSKGRIERDAEVLLSDEEYESIIISQPDAFEVLDDVQESEIKQSMKSGEEGSQIRFGVKNWDGNLDALKTRKGDPGEARSIFTPSLWNEISELAETRRVLDRLHYPRG